MIPAAPLVGAVTTLPPAAFSSFTASATRLTQSCARAGSPAGSSALNRSCHRRALRRTLRPPDEVAATFLLTAGAIGSIYKEQASISGAEVGCQGEVGSASAMAAAGLAEILAGTPAQVENAAEIAMEHGLDPTCDPVTGLVQIPFERAEGAFEVEAA